MTADLAGRLRLQAGAYDDTEYRVSPRDGATAVMLREAASEIERLEREAVPTAELAEWVEAVKRGNATIDRYRAALEAIVRCESVYSMDPLKRAEHAIDHCQETARTALAEGASDGG